MNDDGKVKAEHGPDGAPSKPPGPTRRQFLGGLTTGTLAVGALSQAGCGPAVPPLKTLGEPMSLEPEVDRVAIGVAELV